MKTHRTPLLGRTVVCFLGLLSWIGCTPLAPDALIALGDGTGESYADEAPGPPDVDSSISEAGANDPDRTARRRDSVTTSIDWGFPFSTGIWHLTFVATPTDAGEWDVRAEFEPDGIGFHQCSSPCAGDPCRFWDMRGTARTRVLLSPLVATEIAADGCSRHYVCGGRRPVTVYCTLTIDLAGVASVSDFFVQ